MVLSMSPMVMSQSSAVVELSDLDGSDGFVINGVDSFDRSGESVDSAGDVNGDGFDDLLVGAVYADPNGNSRAGISYVVFGNGDLGSTGTLELSDLDGANGFVLNGIDTDDYSGSSISGVGDVNGDNVDDFIIGARNANNGAGASYVVFGGVQVGSGGAVELTDLDGSDGFVLNGIYSGDQSGTSVSGAGDINGDSVNDLVIGAPFASLSGYSNSGETYVVFGDLGVGSSGTMELSDLDGSDGFVLRANRVFDVSGRSVSGAGDFNNDGVDDLLIGASSGGANRAGEAYVVFGSSSIGGGGIKNLSDLNGTDGLVLSGASNGDFAGFSVSDLGDFNDDGIDDVIIGAFRAAPNGNVRAGASYVVFGNGDTDSDGVVALGNLDGTNGFVVNGIVGSDYSGNSVSGVQDINGDGIDDLLIGASGADPNAFSRAGASYVVFGGNSVGSGGILELSALDSADGFLLVGIDSYDFSGGSVSNAGDIDGDGLADLIISSVGADPNGNSGAGESYVVFGQTSAPILVQQCNDLAITVDLNLGQTPGPGDDVILGTPGNDDIRGRAGNDTICGMGGDDFLHGNSGDDWIDGGDGIDNIRGGQGDDTLFSGSGATVGTSSRVFGGNGVDAIFGGPDADDLRGGRGDDVISGEQGADLIIGNDNDDVLFGGPGADDIRGGGGDNDELFGEGGGDTLNGGSGGNDFCDGGGQGGDTDTNCEVF